MKKLIILTSLIFTVFLSYAQSEKPNFDKYYSYSLSGSLDFIHYKGNDETWRKFSMHWKSKKWPNPYFKEEFTYKDFVAQTKELYTPTEIKSLLTLKKNYRGALHIKGIITASGTKYKYVFPDKYNADKALKKHLKKLLKFVKKLPKFDFNEFSFDTGDTIVCYFEIHPRKKMDNEAYLTNHYEKDLSEIDTLFRENPFKSAYQHWIHEYRYIENKTEENRVTFKVNVPENTDVYICFGKHNLIIKGEVKNGECVFRMLPKDISLTIIAISFTGKTKAAIVNENTTKKKVSINTFNSYTLKDFNNALFEK